MTVTVGLTTVSTARIIEHAFRRAGVGVEKQTPDTVQLARDNLFFLFASYSNRGLPLWCVEEVSIPIVAGTKMYECPAGTVDVMMVNLRSVVGATYTDRPVTRMSRDQYFLLPNKEVSGTPVQYWYDRQLEPTLTLWPVPTDATQTLRVVRQRQIGGSFSVDCLTCYRQHLCGGKESRPQQHTWNRFEIIQDYII